MVTIVTVSVAPLAIVPIGQVTTPAALEQVPCEAVALTKPAPFGRVSVAATPVAVSGPLLVTVSV